VLILRAAIESLGALAAAGGHAQPGDAALLVTHLDDESRDVRATTARSLAELCDTTAIVPLQVRATMEKIPQVQQAITEALRVLDTCTPS
jgi:HEAT repeat protein